MARDPGTYSEEIVREFYASYAATLRGLISKRSKPLAQDPLTSTMVRGCPVDISPATISLFLYGPTTGHSWYIAADGEHAEWVATPRLGIRKATSNFVAKFFWLLVRNRVSPTKVDNQLTWDKAVMAAALVAGVEIDFARMLLAEIHERAFKTSTTYPFPFEPKAAPTALADDTVLDALFSGTAEERLEPTHAKGKWHRSSRTEEEKSQKRQRRQEKEARKASILDEKLLQRRMRESAAGASSSAPVVEVPPVVRDVVSTTDGAMMDDVGNTEGDPTIDPAGSGKPDPPARS
uniref:Integrase core domain containing protein n=1 Tax=Solanum tuberosum TaxID=4113 RepID=M1DWJ5_SOLTU